MTRVRRHAVDRRQGRREQFGRRSVGSTYPVASAGFAQVGQEPHRGQECRVAAEPALDAPCQHFALFLKNFVSLPSVFDSMARRVVGTSTVTTGSRREKGRCRREPDSRRLRAALPCRGIHVGPVQSPDAFGDDRQAARTANRLGRLTWQARSRHFHRQDSPVAVHHEPAEFRSRSNGAGFEFKRRFRQAVSAGGRGGTVQPHTGSRRAGTCDRGPFFAREQNSAWD